MSNWWLVSWTTYATWLPGDKRGFCTWHEREYIPPPTRFALQGEATYRAADFTHVHESAERISEEPVCLSAEQMQMALGALIAEIAQTSIVPAIISLGSGHVHWLCHFGTLRIRPTVSRLKAAATRELNAFGFQGKRPWTKGCNMRSKRTRQACRAAYKYVRDHRHQGCLVYEWPIDPRYLIF
jgi:hypothetical protein